MTDDEHKAAEVKLGIAARQLLGAAETMLGAAELISDGIMEFEKRWASGRATEQQLAVERLGEAVKEAHRRLQWPRTAAIAVSGLTAHLYKNIRVTELPPPPPEPPSPPEGRRR